MSSFYNCIMLVLENLSTVQVVATFFLSACIDNSGCVVKNVTILFPVNKQYNNNKILQMKLSVKWALVDQDGVNQVCIVIPVKLQS